MSIPLSFLPGKDKHYSANFQGKGHKKNSHRREMLLVVTVAKFSLSMGSSYPAVNLFALTPRR
jgi:hypothetical protein